MLINCNMKTLKINYFHFIIYRFLKFPEILLVNVLFNIVELINTIYKNNLLVLLTYFQKNT